jgi:hypothetical protein
MTHKNVHRGPDDAFSDWLDAAAPGMSTPEATADADLEALQVASRQFHGLVDAANQHALAIRSRPKSWEDIMHTTLSSPPVSAFPPGSARTHRAGPFVGSPPRAWMSAALVAILLAGLALGFGSVLDRFRDEGALPPEQTTIPFAGFADNDLAGDATPVPMGESSSIPYPNEANCTVTPMTRDEVIAHLEAANVATEPEYQYYERPIVASEEDALGIMSTFRMWQACRGLSHLFVLETPWFTANYSVAFWNPERSRHERPMSDDRIQEVADIAILDEDQNLLLIRVATPAPEDIETIPGFATPDIVPLPDDATPVPIPSGGNWPTIFPENIEIVGPDHAIATVVIVNSETGDVLPGVVLYYDFVKVDGKWLLAGYSEHDSVGRG